jgi:hypothetical protein
MKAGTWLTLHEISVGTGDPEASVSARLRDLRKTKFGGHEVERQNLGGGRWVYRLVLPGEAVHESVQRDDDHPHAPEINEDHEGGEHLAEF